MYALNKLDLLEARERAPKIAKALGKDALAISAATGEGVPDLLKRIWARTPDREVVEAKPPGERRIAFSGGGRDWTVARENEGYRVKGGRVEQLARGLDWESPDAAAYFQRLLQRQGIEKELRRRGGKDGDTVRIGVKELEWTESCPR